MTFGCKLRNLSERKASSKDLQKRKKKGDLTGEGLRRHRSFIGSFSKWQCADLNVENEEDGLKLRQEEEHILDH